MGDFEFYPSINKRLNYVFNIHDIINKSIPEEFDKYLQIIKFTLEFLKKYQKDDVSSVGNNITNNKIDHIITCSSNSGKFMKDELTFLRRFNGAPYFELLELLKNALQLRNRRIRKITLWSFWRKQPYLEMNPSNNIYLFIFDNNDKLINKFDAGFKNKGISEYTKDEIFQLLEILENVRYTINYLMYKSIREDRIIFSDNKNVTIKRFYDKIKKIENVELSILYNRTLSLWSFWSEKFEKVNIKCNLDGEAYI